MADSPDPNSKRGKISILANRLIALGKVIGKKSRPERIEIRIAPLAGAAGPHINRHLLSAFDGPAHAHAPVRVKPLNETIPYDPTDPEQNDFANAIQQARIHLAASKADLLIWGEAAAAGTTMTLRFLSAASTEIDQLGYSDAQTEIHLPVDFDETLANVLFAISITAIPTQTAEKTQAFNNCLPGIVNTLLDSIQNLPASLTSREQASIQFCAGNTFAFLASHQHIIPFYQYAVALYQSALATLTATERPIDWALAHLNLAACLLSIAERDENTALIQTGIDSSEAAIEVFKQSHKYLYAVAQNRLGSLLYKMDLHAGDKEVLKKSLNAFQAALKIFSRHETPRLWADTKNNLAQVALVLGEHMQSPEVLGKAVDACNSTLAVRTKDDDPLPWAATQNNLGSGLFMLGKMTHNAAALQGAHTAFSQALEVYEEHGAKRRADLAAKNLNHVQRLIDKGDA